MGRKKTQVPFRFEDAPEGKTFWRIRNITEQTLAIPNKKSDLDLFLMPFVEVTVGSRDWLDNRNIRNAVKNGQVEIEWVDEFYMPRRMPQALDAPSEFLCESPHDAAYATQIALKTNERQCLDLIEREVMAPDTGETDVPFMKTRMLRALRTADWLERQIQNRPKILLALKDRISWIRSL